MRAGLTRTTVTGMARFWASQTWVMPTFSPTIALVATCASFFLYASVTDTQTLRRVTKPERSARLVWSSVPQRATEHFFFSPQPLCEGYQSYTTGPRARKGARVRGVSNLANLDLDVHAGREVESLERVDGL